MGVQWVLLPALTLSDAFDDSSFVPLCGGGEGEEVDGGILQTILHFHR